MGQRLPGILIVSLKDDLHALSAKYELDASGKTKCHILEADNLYCNSALTWEPRRLKNTTLPVRDGSVPLSEIDLIWWRRSGYRQILPLELGSGDSDFINNECRDSLLGALLTGFNGTWISHPTSSMMAENKLIQLSAALKAGFDVPATVITQNAAVARRFCSERNVVIKAVRGTQRFPTPTMLVRNEHLLDNAALSATPIIYQEFIPGKTHLRVLVFGTTVIAVSLESIRVDWRVDLNVPVRGIPLSGDIEHKLIQVLKILNLQMGVFDLKQSPETGNYTWLEVNPQGQFLFAEALSGVPFMMHFAKFLEQRACRAYGAAH